MLFEPGNPGPRKRRILVAFSPEESPGLHRNQYLMCLFNRIFACCLLLAWNQADGQIFKRRDTQTSVELDTLISRMHARYFKQPDSSLFFALEAVPVARREGNYEALTDALNTVGEQYRFLGEFPKSLEAQFEALQENRLHKDRVGEAFSMGFIGFSFLEMGDIRQALDYSLASKPVLDSVRVTVQSSFVASNIASAYTILGKLDSAFQYSQESNRLLEAEAYPPLRTLVYDRMGAVYQQDGQYGMAASWYHLSLFFARQSGILVNISREQKRLAGLYAAQNLVDSAMYYAQGAYAFSINSKQKLHSLDAAQILTDLYKRRGEKDSALHYQGIAMALKDSIYGMDQYRRLQRLLLAEQRHHQEAEEKQRVQQSRLRFAILGLIAAGLLGAALVLRRRNQQKQLMNQQLEFQKAELQRTLDELRVTQSQLVQREKMASLGELTAGIAHEIQNPLNFVNNFSELNAELTQELREAVRRGNLEEALVIAGDIHANQEKIRDHGRRADAIVKSMLQHSKASGGSSEPTDINALCAEYARLAFHGTRAKDKDFNVSLETGFDPELPKVKVIPQDIGRVLLNLLHNAFYAVSEQKQQGAENYVPRVMLHTRKANGQVVIEVRDNGPGIPVQIRDKIFQPFFTTKPTGQGTGLGLSLSYDIIKAHGGTLALSQDLSEGSVFEIRLPVQPSL